MISKNLNDWLQIVGLFGVIASLIFVGIQLKQTQDIALSETYQNRTATTIEMNNGALSSSEFIMGISKIYANRENELTMPEAVSLEWYVGTNLTVIENNHWQYEAGFLSEEHWNRNVAEIECMMTVKLFREVAIDWQFRQSFREVLNEIIDRVPEDAENCWSYDWDYPFQET